VHDAEAGAFIHTALFAMVFDNQPVGGRDQCYRTLAEDAVSKCTLLWKFGNASGSGRPKLRSPILLVVLAPIVNETGDQSIGERFACREPRCGGHVLVTLLGLIRIQGVSIPMEAREMVFGNSAVVRFIRTAVCQTVQTSVTLILVMPLLWCVLLNGASPKSHVCFDSSRARCARHGTKAKGGSTMCGRLDQNDIGRLISNFAWADECFNRCRAEPRYNVSPGTYRPVFHLEGDDLFVDDMHWGYRSAWARKSGELPMAINTRRDKIANRYWISMLRRGRVIVPANGWYEWTGAKGAKQPWHIHRQDGSPIYIAALANIAPDTEHKCSNGFTLVTDDADGGMLDMHDRRPVVLSLADAALWLDPCTPADEAEHIARTGALPVSEFAWHKVAKEVGNVTKDGPALVKALIDT
jgi:putative SOS response-associated peptidase YedK